MNKYTYLTKINFHHSMMKMTVNIRLLAACFLLNLLGVLYNTFMNCFLYSLEIARYFLCFLDQETAKCPFRSSSQAAICYYELINHSKVEAISLSALPNDTTSGLASLSSHYSFLLLNVKQGIRQYQL